MTTETANGHQDGQPQRRRPFATWVKKLTNFKNSSDGERNKRHIKIRRGGKLNNPYPESGTVADDYGQRNRHSGGSFTTQQTDGLSLDHSTRYSGDGLAPPTTGARSMAGTVSTENDGPRSINAPSHGASSLAGTSRTIGGGLESRRGGDSTFSSPAPSVQSLATTLTTIQSVGPHGSSNAQPGPSSANNTQSIQFSQPFPTASPASAIPAHLAPPAGNPTTYSTATANNLLTDNASILTLASSSKRRRRRSIDTDASVRALAPSSLWGGSRESLPLSVLSSNVDGIVPAAHTSSSRIPERNSLYSATGVAPAIPSERNSAYAKQGDGASVRSGRLGHGRPDSIGGGISGTTATLASPLETPHSENRSLISEKGDL